MSRECPLCRLTNPDSALRCDCGYDFGTGVIKATYLQIAQNPKAAAQFQELVEKHGSVDAAFKAVAKRTMFQGATVCAVGVVTTAVSLAIAVEKSNQGSQGTYVLCYGAILFGAIQFLRGLRLYLRRR